MFSFIDVCSATKFITTEPLEIGPFSKVIDYDAHFETKLPARLGFEPVPDNICEGIVIKPVIETCLLSGARVCIKKKNEKFVEITGQSVAEFRKKQQAKGETPLVIEGSDLFKSVFDDFGRYFNQNRLDAVISKLGSVTPAESRKLSGLLVQDALEDFLKGNQNVKLLSKVEFNSLKKGAFVLANDVVKDHFNS